MVIVVIHWKIRPDEESVQAFREQWRTMEPPFTEHYSAEFLSEPLAPEQVGFACTTFNVSSDVRYRSFFNVAVWTDAETFREDILGKVVAGRPKREDFEFDHRERMVLRPVMSRPGELPLPLGPGLDP